MFDLVSRCYFLDIVPYFLEKYIQDLLAHVALSDKRIVETPMEPTSTFVSTSAPASLHRNLYLATRFMSTVSIPHPMFPCCATP